MKIIGFAQLHNERLNGNLQNWFACMRPLCDFIYIYDQASNDGSVEYYESQKNVVVIRSNVNDFPREIICKGILLRKLLSDHPDATAILWVDGDTILERAFTRQAVEELLMNSSADMFSFGHYNLWRSDCFYRIDSKYHGLNGKVIALWRNNGKLHFPEELGLHKSQNPLGIERLERCPFSLIHRGFATDAQIFRKYGRYKSFGQSGWALQRLLNEKGLNVVELPDILPEWFPVTDPDDPRTKAPLLQLEEQMES